MSKKTVDRETLDQLATEIGTVTSSSDARAMVNRASRIAAVPTTALETRELLRVCQALAAEGGMIQEVTEAIAW